MSELLTPKEFVEQRFRGPHLEFLHDPTPEIELEGVQSSGKTLVAMWKELNALEASPGMWSFLTRWSEDDVHVLLRPEFERLLRIRETKWAWNSKEKAYEFENGCRVFAFGLRTTAVDPILRYGKIRGIPLSRILVDQAEQVPADFLLELQRRLRPNIEAKIQGQEYPTQLTFVANVVDTFHWLAQTFPESNPHPTERKYYALSLLDNAHNLPDNMLLQALRDCPPSHPKHRATILGRRPEIIDYSKTMKAPYPENSAGALFEQAMREARYAA